MTSTNASLLNQKSNEQTSHELQKNLDKSCISFCTSQGDTKLCHLGTRFQMLYKFLHELTCQISTNQSIKIGRKRDERVIMLGKIKSMKKLVELSSPRQERMIILSCLRSV